MTLNGTQQRLADMMSDASERAYFASWLIGTEYRLWQFVTDPTDSGEWGREVLSGELRSELRGLSEEIGGWICWRDEAPDHEPGAAFLPLAEWLKLYEPWRKGREEWSRLPRRYVDYVEAYALLKSRSGGEPER